MSHRPIATAAPTRACGPYRRGHLGLELALETAGRGSAASAGHASSPGGLHRPEAYASSMASGSAGRVTRMSSSSTSTRLLAPPSVASNRGGPSGRRRHRARSRPSARRRRRRPARPDRRARPRPGSRRPSRRSRGASRTDPTPRCGRRRRRTSAAGRASPAGRSRGERMVVRPSRSLALGVAPARAPVTNAFATGAASSRAASGRGSIVEAGLARAKPGTGRRGIGPVRVDAPAPIDLEVVVEGAAAGGPDRRAEHRQRAPGAFHQVEDGLLVPSGLRGDLRVVRVVHDRHLERVREDPVDAVLVVARRPGADVQVARLLGPVAVGRGHVPADAWPGRRGPASSCPTGRRSWCSRTAT